MKKSLVYSITLLSKIIFIIELILPMFIINNVINKDFKKVIIYTTLIIFINILNIIFNYYSELFIEMYTEEQKIKFINKCSVKIIGQKNSLLLNKEKYISWLTNDANMLKKEYFTNRINIIFYIFISIVLMLSLMYFDIYLFLINLIGAILILLCSKYNEKKYENISYSISKFSEKKIKNLTNIFSNIFSFFFSNNMEKFKEKTYEYNEEYYESYKKTIKKLHIFLLSQYFLVLLTQLCNIFFSFYLIYIGKISIGSIITIGLISGNVTNYFNGIVVAFIEIKNSKKLLKKYEIEILEEKNGTKEIEHIENIEFKNLNIKDVYDNLSIKFEKGKKYLIVGESGVGKSTLIKALFKNIDDYNGEIYINSINIKDIDKYCIYSKIEFVDAENFVFYTNIYNNISIYDEKADKVKIDKILEDLEIDRINKDIEENNVSLGQRQRINLARLLYNDKEVIILDEATANLDEKNRKKIEAKFLETNKLVIFISHHYDGEYMKQFDEVIQLRKGGFYEKSFISK